MNIFNKFFLMTMLSLLSISTYAGECEIEYSSVACPGKEKKAYKKCDGKASCTITKTAISWRQCQKKAHKLCDNHKLKSIRSISTKAKYDGTPVNDGKFLCSPNRNDYNRCRKK